MLIGIVAIMISGIAAFGINKAQKINSERKALEDKRLKEQLQKELEEEEARKKEIKAIIDATLPTLSKPNDFLSMKYDMVSSENKAMVYDALLKTYADIVTNDKSKNSLLTSIESYKTMWGAINTEEKCIVYVELLKMQKQLLDIETARLHTEKITKIKADGDAEIAKMYKDVEFKKIDADIKKAEIEAEKDKEIAKRRTNAATEMIDTLAFLKSK